MIGVSLPLDWLLEGLQPALVQLLKDQQVGSIELRTVRPHHDPAAVAQVAHRLWDNGFQITVHGSVGSLETAVADVFGPLAQLLPTLRQERLVITVHPIVGDNVAMLTALSDYILDNGLCASIALENNRLLPDKTQGDSAELVLAAVTATDRPNVGICFDMGHYAYYIQKNCPQTPRRLPQDAFWKRVIHTHIHAMNGLRTHFPLDGYALPLDDFLDKLSFGYLGVYNLELDFPRIAANWTPEAALANSLPYLKGHLRHCARLYDKVRREFDGWLTSALRCWQATQGLQFSLIHSSSYLFCTNGCRWAMDIAFRYALSLARTPSQAALLLKDMDFMVLSHGHRDHFEGSTLRALAKNKTLFLVPEFLVERCLELGIPREKLVVARPGEAISLKGVTVLPFESAHFRPNGGGVKEYGYYVTAPGCPSLAFPVDIRDFSRVPTLPQADYCFANIWLEDDSLHADSWQPVLEPFCRYMLSFSSKNILLTHLYENGRPDGKMWRKEHALAVKEALSRLSPQTRVAIPQPGECMTL